MSFRFFKPKRPVTRVFIHCSASDNPAHDNAATMDLWHKQRGWAGIGYHFFIRKSGLLEIGRDIEKVPAAQEGNNTKTIAICLHGLEKNKFTDEQFLTLVGLCHQINEAYQGAVTFHGHCEVSAKTCPVFDYRDVLGLKNGKLPRSPQHAKDTVIKTMPDLYHAGLEEPANGVPYTLKLGNKNSAVMDLQRRLDALGYHVGTIDGDFGARTRDAVLAFQADNHLETDGKVGTLTREALSKAEARTVSEFRAATTLASLVSSGSTVAKTAVATRSAGVLLSAGGLLSVVNDATGLVSDLTGDLGAVGEKLQALGSTQGAIMVALGVYVVWQAIRSGRAAVSDFRSGKTA